MICNECAKRKCRTEAVYNVRSGRFTCRQFQKPRSGFPFLELAVERNPESTLRLLHGHKLQAIETKKGLVVRYARSK
jgi:hypothetical protein